MIDKILTIKPTLIYLDVCALCRPYDDQSFLRIKLETEAVNLILSNVKRGYYRLLLSPAHTKEIAAITDILERTELQEVLKEFGMPVVYGLNETKERVEELIKSGLGVADAAHIAFAEQMKAPFISCDEKLIRKC
jgi:predicted nucleic acid-binding protein